MHKFCLKLFGISTMMFVLQSQAWAKCPDALNHTFKRLHSSEQVNLCDLYTGKPILLVNTASHCGFTKQLGDLEKFYQAYKDKGLQVIGFASNSFNQAAKTEEKAAEVCFKNYGVTFTMLAPTPVRGDQANPVFAHLAEKAGQVRWNFNKYFLQFDETGDMQVSRFNSDITPFDSPIERLAKAALEETQELTINTTSSAY